MCPCCCHTIAEILLFLAYRIEHPKGRLMVCQGASKEHIEENLAKAKLALDFAHSPAVVRFRAIVEEWTPERINRELY